MRSTDLLTQFYKKYPTDLVQKEPDASVCSRHTEQQRLALRISYAVNGDNRHAEEFVVSIVTHNMVLVVSLTTCYHHWFFGISDYNIFHFQQKTA
jgi:hypothetical protein